MYNRDNSGVRELNVVSIHLIWMKRIEEFQYIRGVPNIYRIMNDCGTIIYEIIILQNAFGEHARPFVQSIYDGQCNDEIPSLLEMQIPVLTGLKGIADESRRISR